jgi:rRNA maturation RNase YbeY
MPAGRIVFSKHQVSFRLRHKETLRKWLFDVCIKENKTILQLHYIFCNDSEILRLNQTFLNHHYYTDIITFGYSAHNSDLLEGEIYISIDTVRHNAEQLNISFKDELHRVMIHGLLHLCGYRDKTKKEKALMRYKEDAALCLLQQLFKKKKL